MGKKGWEVKIIKSMKGERKGGKEETERYATSTTSTLPLSIVSSLVTALFLYLES